MATRAARLLVPALLLIVAAAYFSLGVNLTLEWADEGHIIYGSWRTAEGALPYRDFHHIYGPSLFFLNGAVFRLFGSDLAGVRASLVVLKSLIAVLVFVAARRVAPWPFALLAYGTTVVIWGVPLWLFAAPYAHYYTTLLTFAALLLYLDLRARPLVGATLAGLLFGLATTFKQTTGVFAAVAFVWFLISRRAAATGTAPQPCCAAGRLLRLGVLAASVAVLAAYASKTAHLWTELVLLTPAALAAGLLAGWEFSRPPTAADHRTALAQMACCALGSVLPWLAYGAFYGGAIGDMLRDLAIPARMRAFWPFPTADGPTALALVAVASAAVAIRLLAARAGRRRSLGLAASAGVLLITAVLYARSAAAARGSIWMRVVLGSLYWLPPLSVWAALPSVFGWRAKPPQRPAPAEALALLVFYAVTSLLFLSPLADIAHLLQGLPIYLVLCAYLLARLQQASGRAPHPATARVATAALAAGLALWIGAPFVQRLRQVRMSLPSERHALARATGVFDPRPEFEQEVDLVDWLRDPQRRDRAVFAIGSPQMLYFVVGRPSPLEQDEFVFFLVSYGLLSVTDARDMVNEADLLATLDAARPLVVEGFGTLAAQRFRDAFPGVGGYLDRHYRPVARFGQYTVLDTGAGEGA